MWQLNGTNLALALCKQLLEWLTQPWEKEAWTVFADSLTFLTSLEPPTWGAHKQCSTPVRHGWLTGLRLKFPRRHKQWRYQFSALGLLTGVSRAVRGQGEASLCSAGPKCSQPSTDLLKRKFLSCLPWSFRFTSVHQPVYKTTAYWTAENHWVFSEQKILPWWTNFSSLFWLFLFE